MTSIDDIKEIVTRTLEAKGVLGKIKAELRASVFTAIDEQEKVSGVYLENPLVQKLLSSHEGRVAVDLIREFLEFYELDYTLSVLVPEANLPEHYAGREAILKEIRLRPDPKQNRPLLVEVFDAFLKLSAGGTVENRSTPIQSVPNGPAPRSTLSANAPALIPSIPSNNSKPQAKSVDFKLDNDLDSLSDILKPAAPTSSTLAAKKPFGSSLSSSATKTSLDEDLYDRPKHTAAANHSNNNIHNNSSRTNQYEDDDEDFGLLTSSGRSAHSSSLKSDSGATKTNVPPSSKQPPQPSNPPLSTNPPSSAPSPGLASLSALPPLNKGSSSLGGLPPLGAPKGKQGATGADTSPRNPPAPITSQKQDPPPAGKPPSPVVSKDPPKPSPAVTQRITDSNGDEDDYEEDDIEEDIHSLASAGSEEEREDEEAGAFGGAKKDHSKV
mmetsp:Transcript_6454/g.10027  ORF Transcript_6454/g.10027 Transcript_6454/m.10027 type:complete len:440 (-) Transcript_6454:797-2116(-)